GAPGQPRTGAANILVEDVHLLAGQTYTVDVLPGETATLKGLQGTFKVAATATVTAVTPGQFGAANYNPTHLDRGQLGFSYSEAEGLAPEVPLLSFSLVAEQDAYLSELLSFTDDLVASEGYNTDNTAVNLGISFSSAEVSTATEITNYPNPMGSQTTVSYTLPESGAASFTVRDMAGRVVVQRDLAVVAGANQLVLYRNEIPTAGVYTYTLTAGDTSLSRKLVVK
ncbi:MAG: T9SS type A sorting domain-containing protein, partial [Bacteroidota bacterium]